LAREGCFAASPRPEQLHHPASLESAAKMLDGLGPRDHDDEPAGNSNIMHLIFLVQFAPSLDSEPPGLRLLLINNWP
jgi:hypothetical protein